MTKSAVISADGLYRYELRRVWDESKPLLNFVLLNPSKADAEIDDQTIRRLISFAKAWGYGGIIVTNLYAFRSTDPKALWYERDPIGPENERYLKQAAQESAAVVCAWGANAHRDHADRLVRQLLMWRTFSHKGRATLYCFGKTKNGAPRHPVRLARDTQLVKL